MAQEDIRSLLSHVAAVMDQQCDRALWERLGIGMAQYRVLAVVEDIAVPTQRMVADRLGLTEAGISRQVGVLLAKEYLARTINKKNKRENILQLTSKGRRLLAASQQILDTYAQKPLQELNDKQQKALLDFVKKAHNSMCVSEECGHRQYVV